jgi:ATP-binding cassette subfamily F protein 3
VAIRGGTTIGYLQQEVLEDVAQSQTVLEHVISSFEDLAALEQSEQSILAELERHREDADRTARLLIRLEKTHAKMEALEAHRLEHRAEAVLSGLGFESEEMQRPVESFSGGWRMRMALATLLLQSPDLLLLDEPTNHLDIETIDWLEQYLSTYQGAVILVSHDRYFLDRMVTEIAELSGGQITQYFGNYEKYLEERALRVEQHRAAYENQQREIRQAERFIERFRAKATKAKQAQSRIKMLERMERIQAPVEENASVFFRFPEGVKPYRVVLSLSEFSKSYPVDGAPNIQVFDQARALTVERGDRIALAGKNGAGKSTLARILKGIEPFEGERTLGGRVEIGFFAQNQGERLDPSKSVLGSMQQVAYGWSETEIRSLLGAFLFSGDDVEKGVAVLSGGERSRLALAITLVTPANFLILDEPTNHLDIRSRNALVQALNQFPGTFVVISHDRHFLDRVASKIWYVANGDVREFLGTYSEMRTADDHEGDQERPVDAKIIVETQPREPARASGPKTKEQKRLEAEARKQRSQQKKQLEKLVADPSSREWDSLPVSLRLEAIALLESRIDHLENQKSRLETQLANPDFYSDSEKSSMAVNEFEQLERTITEALARWEALSELAED